MEERTKFFENIKNIIQEELGDQVSNFLKQRLLERVEQCGENKIDVVECLRSIRLAINLFVDEDMAESLYQRLKKEAQKKA